MVVLGGWTDVTGAPGDCNAMVVGEIWVVLRTVKSTVRRVSLNPCEQLLYDYVEKHPEERQYWMHKVRGTAELCASPYTAAERLDIDLWAYFKERAAVVPVFKEFAARQGLARTSMRNLAEYLLRLWAPPKKKRTGPPADPSNN